MSDSARDYQDVIERLRLADWRFADYNSASEQVSLHSIHWYPAPFVPQLPSMLIKSLGERGDLVLDPFCGTGVTGLEAARLGHRIAQSDINPLAVDIAHAKLLAPVVLTEAFEQTVRSRLSAVRGDVGDSVDCTIDEEAEKWFHAGTLQTLRNLKSLIDCWENDDEALILRVMFSGILHKTSSQRNHYSYVVDNCRPKELIDQDALGLFLERLDMMTVAAGELRRRCALDGISHDFSENGLPTVSDARNLEEVQSASVDLVVTSPPYLYVNDYVKSQRLTYFFFGPFPSGADSSDLGSRRTRHRKQRGAEDFLIDMQRCWDEIARVTKPKGFVCLLMGQSSTVSSLDTVANLEKAAEERFGGPAVLQIDRRILFRKIQNRGIGTERLLIFQRL